MSAGARLLDRLDGVRPSGEGRWQARCPGHEDRAPSLSVTEKANGDLLVHCHAGCDTPRLLGEVGLTTADLFAERRNGGREIVATYDYVDERGDLLFQVVRFHPKDFRQRRPDGSDGWTWKLGDTQRVLYRLPRVLEAVARSEHVMVVEGEKDADRLHDHSLRHLPAPPGQHVAAIPSKGVQKQNYRCTAFRTGCRNGGC